MAIVFTTLQVVKSAVLMEKDSTVLRAHRWAALMANAFTMVLDDKYVGQNIASVSHG